MPIPKPNTLATLTAAYNTLRADMIKVLANCDLPSVREEMQASLSRFPATLPLNRVTLENQVFRMASVLLYTDDEIRDLGISL